MNNGRLDVRNSRPGRFIGRPHEHPGAFDHFLEGAAGLSLGIQKFPVRLGRLLLKRLDRFQSFLDNGQGLVNAGRDGRL